MELRDLLVTPAFLLLIYGVAFLVRPYATDEVNRVYYFPALTAKIFGAIALGVVYQYYYGSGDTFMYHTYGSRFVWKAFLDSPIDGLKLLFADSRNPGDVYQYASQIYLFRDSNSYMLIRLAAVFDLLTFSTYSSTAALFAVLSFIGSWQFYLTFYKQFPHLHGRLAIAAFFIPSVFFWGSGVLKDTVTLACLGIATYQIYLIFIARKARIINILLLLASLYLIFSIRKFILQAYLPSVLLWLGASQVYRIPSVILRAMVVPFVALILIASGYFTVAKIGEEDERYALSNIAKTSRVTAYDIRYWSGRYAGSGYSLGELDGSLESMVRLAPQAINVSLFRPYLWEVKNSLMLFSAAESFVILLVVLYVLARQRGSIFGNLAKPNVIFALSFTLVFAFAIGASTYNFGTLVRYKIPLLPFFVTALVLLLDYRKSEMKLDRLESTE
ncbi:MAG: hypothetical protein JNN04_03910 [Cyclobacteriaceae bacterium]|nr:hypothetical protein [Cyclobacteriaceae bacterium]